ncbi:hypothetical protein [Caballeronia sp. Sq4a]|uniref:hypothetical protein n=1 Tax=Caballeronia sp. Sq4a TaxID=2878152 RepID=UPI0020C0FBC2|nr:hypothetical protein [Caballeronia sp. Sq4a]
MSGDIQLLESGEAEMREVRRRAAIVLRTHPQLAVSGWCSQRSPANSRDFDYEAVRTAVLFVLTFCKRGKTVDKKTHSYRLKHCAENWGKETGLTAYISTGAFILAALICGYECRRCGIGDPNCTFDMNIDEKNVHRYDYHVFERPPSAFTRMKFK